MIHNLAYITVVALAQLTLLCVFAGVGYIGMRAVRMNATKGHILGLGPILGWCMVLAGLQVWSIFRPVNAIPITGLLVVGTGGLMWLILDKIKNGIAERSTLLVLGLALAISAIWVANQTSVNASTVIYDTDLYHASTVKWIKTFAAVPGLGNLHSRFAFNNSYFLYDAMLGSGPFTGKAHHLAGGVLILMLLLKILSGIQMMARKDGPITSQAAFDALLIVPTVSMTMGSAGFAPTLSPDLGVFVLGAFLASEILAYWEAKETRDGKKISMRFVVVVLLSVAGTVTKSSFAAFGLAACLLVLSDRVWKERTLDWKARVGVPVSVAGIVAGVYLIPFFTRGVIASGYPLYPLPFFRFPVDWALPVSELQRMQKILFDFSLHTYDYPIDQIGFVRWFKAWLDVVLAEKYAFVTPILIGLIIAPLLHLVSGHSGKREKTDHTIWVVMLLPVFSLTVWFASAPDVRYAGIPLWCLGFYPLAIVLRKADRAAALSVITCVGGVLLANGVNGLDFIRKYNRDIGPLTSRAVHTERTNTGLDVYVPNTGEQCGDALLPCTPYFNPCLKLRSSGDLSKGFMVDSRSGRCSENPIGNIRDQ